MSCGHVTPEKQGATRPRCSAWGEGWEHRAWHYSQASSRSAPGLVLPLPSHPRTIHKPVTLPELATSLVFPQGISPQMLPAWHSSVIKSWGSDPGPHGSRCPDRAGQSWSREQHTEDRGNRGDWKRCRPEVDFTLTAAAHLRKQSQGSAFQGEDVKSLQEGQPFTATTFNPKHYYIPLT